MGDRELGVGERFSRPGCAIQFAHLKKFAAFQAFNVFGIAILSDNLCPLVFAIRSRHSKTTGGSTGIIALYEEHAPELGHGRTPNTD